MKVHKSTFVIALEASVVKCVHLALEMEASKEEQRDVVCVLVAEGAGTRMIHRCMSAVYGEHCMYLATVHK